MNFTYWREKINFGVGHQNGAEVAQIEVWRTQRERVLCVTALGNTRCVRYGANAGDVCLI